MVRNARRWANNDTPQKIKCMQNNSRPISANGKAAISISNSLLFPPSPPPPLFLVPPPPPPLPRTILPNIIPSPVNSACTPNIRSAENRRNGPTLSTKILNVERSNAYDAKRVTNQNIAAVRLLRPSYVVVPPPPPPLAMTSYMIREAGLLLLLLLSLLMSLSLRVIV